jgi:hypothetical protein
MHYSNGQTVFISVARQKQFLNSCSEDESQRVAVVIHSGLVGRDGREWYVYERASEGDGTVHYDIAPYSAFFDSQQAESNFTKQLREEPGFAREFLTRAGILDQSGELAEHLR